MRSIRRVDFIWFLPIISVFIPGSICSEKLGKKYVVFDSGQINFEGNLPPGITFKPEQNIISAIKTYKGDVYVTIPRHGQTGIPATLAKVFKSESGVVLFTPFPTWEFQTLGNCEMLQDVRSIEVDPRTDLMYIADNGDGQNCKPKLVVYDLVKKAVKSKYTLSRDGNNENTQVNNLGDLVVDNHGMVYIANSDKFGSLWIVNTKDGKVYFIQDHSFKGVEIKPFVFQNDTYSKNRTINMLTLSPDSRFLFYSANSLDIWQVKNDIKDIVTWKRGELGKPRSIGNKNYPGLDIVMGHKFLYFSNVANKSISYWNRKSDLETQRAEDVIKENEALLKIQPRLEYFPGKISLDEDGYLWIVTMDLGLYFNDTDDAKEGFRIVKVFVDDKPYISPQTAVSSSAHKLWSAAIVVVFCLLVLI